MGEIFVNMLFVIGNLVLGGESPTVWGSGGACLLRCVVTQSLTLEYDGRTDARGTWWTLGLILADKCLEASFWEA